MLSRYSNNESWEEVVDRCVNYVGFRNIKDSILSKKFIPAGRILKNAGTSRPMLLNCAVIGSGDSRDEIGQTLKEMLIVAGTGCGVGISGRFWRPKGASISSGGHSSGSLSWFKTLNQLGEAIGEGYDRRVALLFSQSVRHPDIREFIQAKVNDKELPTANISIEYDNKFIQAVQNKEKWQLIWGGRVFEELWARDLWDEIIDAALTRGDPGLLNIGLAEEMANSYYISPIVTTNPCGEEFLLDGDVCNLGSISIDKLIHNNTFDWTEFSHLIRLGVRFLDKVLDVNHFPLKRMERLSSRIRRVGLGIMGYHTLLLKLGLAYDSVEALELLKDISFFKRDVAYDESIRLAKEKGPFPYFDVDKYLQSKFVQNLSPRLKYSIKRWGIRNITCLTQAPTGTTSLLAECSAGIEPIYAPVYDVKYKENGEWCWKRVTNPLLKQLKDKSIFKKAVDISIEHQLKMQVLMAEYIDAGCSKTINLPTTFSKPYISDLLLEYAAKIKGITFYPTGSREGEPLVAVDTPDEYICRSGVCEI